MSQASVHVEGGREPTDRRVYPRQTVHSIAYVELGEGNGGIVLNVSEGGIAVQAMISVLNDDLPHVYVQLSESNKRLEAKGSIAWSSDLRRFVGVKFVDLSQEARSLIQEWASLEASHEKLGEETTSPTEKSEPPVAAQSISETEDPIPGQAPLGNTGATTNYTQATFTTPAAGPTGSAPLAATAQPAALRSLAAPSSEKTQEARAPAKGNSGIPEKWQWALGSLVIVALLVALFIQLATERPLSSSAIKTEPSIDSHLGLKLDRAGTDWRLSWNPNAPALLNATKGQLFVTDGDQRKTVDLDASDLHSGTIIYSPLTNDVVWKLQVGDTGVSPEPISESVRIVGGLASPSSAPGKSQTPASRSPVRVVSAPDETFEVQGRSRPETKRTIGETESKTMDSGGNLLSSKTATRPVAAPSARPQAALKPAGAFAKNSPPNMIPRTAGSAIPSVEIREQPDVVPVLPAKPSEIQPLASAPRRFRRGGSVQPAQLLSSINPVYPALARQSGASGTVELRFKIGINGDVSDIYVVKGSAIFAQAAVEAVGYRKYKPARVEGVPVETEASAIFDFKLN